MSSPLRQALRRLSSSPLFTVTAIVTLALGIGANTAIFSVIHGVLLEPLPYEEPERLVGVWYTAPGLGYDQVNQSAATYLALRDQTELFEDVALWDGTQVTITGLGEPERVDGMQVTDGLLPILGVSASLGRTFEAEDDAPDAPRTAMISDAYWQRRFGGAVDVIGRSLSIDGEPAEIIGVLPEGFRVLDREADVYQTLRLDPSEVFMGQFNYQGVGRLKPGVTLEQANAEVDRLIWVAVERFSGGLTKSMLEEARFGAEVHPLKEDVVGSIGEVLWVLLGTVGLLLLIACANVANLFLVRAEARQREVALRTALGAGRARLARGFLAESLALGLLGGLVGLALAWAALHLLVRLAPTNLPRVGEIGIDGSVLLFTLGVSLLAGLAFGLVPVARLRLEGLAASLKDGGRGASAGRERHRLRNGLVVAQVALALVLLVGSGLMVRSFQALRSVWPGFDDPEEVLIFRIAIPGTEAKESLEVVQMHERITRALEALPGAVSVGASSSVTMDGWDSNDAVWVEGFPVEEGQLPPIRRYKFVTGDYFSTMGNPLIAGRAISWADIHEGAPVAVITENFAREYWDDPAEAVGRRVSSGTMGEDGDFRPGLLREVVGVVGNVHDDGVDQEAPKVVYWPIAMEDFWGEELFAMRSLHYAIRTEGRPAASLLPEARDAVWSVNANLPLANPRTLDELLERSLARTSFTMVMLALAAAVALLMGTIGIYGVLSYLISQRTQEIGVRMALGAERRDVRRMMLRQGMVLAALGIGIGAVAAGLSGRLMAALLFGVQALDPLTYLVVALFLAGVTLFASLMAAQRATRVDPLVALRAD